MAEAGHAGQGDQHGCDQVPDLAARHEYASGSHLTAAQQQRQCCLRTERQATRCRDGPRLRLPAGLAHGRSEPLHGGGGPGADLQGLHGVPRMSGGGRGSTCGATERMSGQRAASRVKAPGKQLGSAAATSAVAQPSAAAMPSSSHTVSRTSACDCAAGRKASAACSSGVWVKLLCGCTHAQDPSGLARV